MTIKYITQLTVIASVVVLSACSKDFLNQKPNNGTPPEISIKNDAEMNVAVNGMYASMRNTNLYGRSLPIRGDLMSDNAFLTTSNSGRYRTFNQYTIIETDADARSIWLNAYAVIKNANNIIDADIPANDNTSQLKSEAYAVRALMHFELVRNFATPYTDDPGKNGIPIVLKYDQNATPGRGTVQAVYDQIKTDCDSAISLAKYAIGGTMTFNTTNGTRKVDNSHFNKYAVYALLARVYQHMGLWTEAKNAALEVVTNGGFTLTSSTNLGAYWATLVPNTAKVETIFQITSDSSFRSNNGSDKLSDMYLPTTLGGAYGDVLCTKELYDSYSATDARKALIQPGARAGQLSTAYIVKKYTGNTVDYDDTKVLRYADVLLILAEAYYHLENDGVKANQYLNMVAKQRDPSQTDYSHTGNQLLDDIINERRKELAFEGSRFWDLYRLKKSFTKIVDQDAPGKNIAVTPATTNMVLPIPFDEMNANPNMKGQQNSGYAGD